MHGMHAAGPPPGAPIARWSPRKIVPLLPHFSDSATHYY